MNHSAMTRKARRPRWLRPGLLWFAFDLLVPTALLYIMLWLGSSLYAGLLASATLSAISALISWRRGTGDQRFAPYMLVFALAAFAISLVTGSDRFLLAKESLLTSIAGLWFLGSLWSARPLTYQFTRPLLEGGWGRRMGLAGASWETLWEHEPHFRHIWRVSSVMWATALLIDAVLRVVMAYTLPVNSVPAMQLALMLVTVVLMQPVTNIYYARAGLWRLVVENARSNTPGNAPIVTTPG